MEPLLTRSDEDYLEMIYRNLKPGEGIRLTDLAMQVGVSKASANQAVEKLKGLGLVRHRKYGVVFLTEEGENTARRIDLRHRSIRLFLTRILHVSEKTAEEDACRIEHVISSETTEQIIRYTDEFFSK